MSADELAQALDELGHARKAIQRPAAERLADAARGDPSLRAPIAALLRSPDARRRWGAAYALAQLEAAPLDALPVMLEALGSSDGDVRWASARLLIRAAGHAPYIDKTTLQAGENVQTVKLYSETSSVTIAISPAEVRS